MTVVEERAGDPGPDLPPAGVQGGRARRVAVALAIGGLGWLILGPLGALLGPLGYAGYQLARRWGWLAVVVALTACAGPAMWHHPTATEEQKARDSYECERDATSSSRMVISERLYRTCMKAKGYTRR